MKRVFLAIDLPDDIRAALTVQQFLLPLPRRVPPESFHLTLVFLGDCPLPVLEAMHEALASLSLPALSVQIQGFGLFGGDRPHSCHACLAPNPPLMALQAKVETAARRAGASPPARRFHPHVTLGRFRPPPLPEIMGLERAVALGAGFALPPFHAREMVLFESHLGGKSPHYAPLARYPLIA